MFILPFIRCMFWLAEGLKNLFGLTCSLRSGSCWWGIDICWEVSEEGYFGLIFFIKFDSLMLLSVAKWTKDMFYLNLHCIGKEDSPVWVVWSKNRWEIKWQELFAGYKYIHVCVSFKISRVQRRQCVLNNELLSAASRQLFQLDQTQSHSSDKQDWAGTSVNKKYAWQVMLS